MPTSQSAQNHTAVDPTSHLILMPVFTLSFALAIYLAARSRGEDLLLHLLLVAVTGGLVLLNMRTRTYTLRVQDRIIRLEERVRLTALLPPAEAAAAVAGLSLSQLIALRFASDAELPALVARTLAEQMTPKAIKAAIVAWRPDFARV